jgi:RNA polymerase sigma-70 factor, ECF subfamily
MMEIAIIVYLAGKRSLAHDESGSRRPLNLAWTGTRMPTDEELMQAVAQGDLNAFEQIVLRHQQTAWAVANRFLGDPSEAEDVAQDAFLKILAAAPRYRPSAAFRTFLIRVVSRLCMDRARKMHPFYTDEPPELPATDPSASQTALRVERDMAIRRALDALPPAQRMAVVLRYYEDLDYRAIADAMDTTEKAVERLLARARVALRVPLSHFRMSETGSGGGFGPLVRL